VYFKARSNEYLSNGVVVTPSNPETYQNVTIVYNGLLAQRGANELWAHVGFGDGWQGTQELKMLRTSSGYEVTIPAANAESLNVAFHDPLNNWDNNNGMNYNFNIQQ
jgi:hypothetical protein